jgi:MinD-like ATPase involved in chromosome partitioning or flagellar assembly
MEVMDRNKSYTDLANKFIRRSELDKATTYVDKITDVNKKDILYESIFNKYLSKVKKNMEKKGRFSFKKSHTPKSIYFKKKAEKVIKKIRSKKKQNKLSKKLKKLD